MEKEMSKSSTREAKREGEMHRQTGGTEWTSNGMLLTKVAVAAPSRGKEGGAFCRMSLKNILVLRLDEHTVNAPIGRDPSDSQAALLVPAAGGWTPISRRVGVWTARVILPKTSH